MILRLVLSFCILCFVTDNSWANQDTDPAQSPIEASVEPCKDGETDHESHARFLRSYSEESVDTTPQNDRALSKEQDKIDDDMFADSDNVARTNHYKREMDIITNESKTKVIKIPDEYINQGTAFRFEKRRDCYTSITIKRIIVGILEHVRQNPQDIDMLISQIRAEIETETELAWFSKRLKPSNMKPLFSQYKNSEFADYSTCAGRFTQLSEIAATAYKQLENYPLCLQVIFGYNEPVFVEEKPNDTSEDVNVIITSILSQMEKYLRPTSETRPIQISETKLHVIPEVNVNQQVHVIKPDIVRPLPEPITEMQQLNIKPEISVQEAPESYVTQYTQLPSMSSILEIISSQNQNVPSEQPYTSDFIPQEVSTQPDYVSDEPDYMQSPQQQQKPQYPLFPQPQPDYTPSPLYVQQQPEYSPAPQQEPEYPQQDTEYNLAPQQVPQYPPQQPEYNPVPQQEVQYPQQEPEYNAEPEQEPQYPQQEPQYQQQEPEYPQQEPQYPQQEPEYKQQEPEYDSAPQHVPEYPQQEPQYNPTPQQVPLYPQPQPSPQYQPSNQGRPQNQVITEIYQNRPEIYPMPDIQYEGPDSQIYEISNVVQSQPKPFKPQPTYQTQVDIYPKVYVDQKEPVYIKPTQEIYIEQIEQQPQPAYYDTKDIIVETNPLYPTPTAAYPEPRPVYPEPKPSYVVPIYSPPKPAYVEPVYPETNLVYPSPTPIYPDPKTVYPEPKPVYPEPTIVYDEPTSIYVENQPVYVDSQSVYSNPVYIEPTPLYTEPTPEIYSDVIVQQPQPSEMPSKSRIVSVLLQLISDQPSATNIDSIVKILKKNRHAFKPRLYKILFALVNGFRKGKIDADEFNETFYFLLHPQKNKIWDEEKRQLLSYLLLPDVGGQVELDNLDIISPLIHAQDASSLNILDEILPIVKAIQEGRADHRAIEVVLTLLNQNQNRILRPEQINILLSLIKPNKKGQVPDKYVDIATRLVNWNRIPYLNPDYVNVIFQLLRPNLNGVIDHRAVEIIHKILIPKKSNFLTPKDINSIFSFLRPESGSVDPKRLDIVLFILNNLAISPRIIDNLIKILPETDINSKYVDVLLFLQSRQLLNTQLVEGIVNLLKQEKLGVVDQQIIDNLLSLLEPYKLTHPKIVIDIYNLLRPIPESMKLNEEPNNVKVLLYQLINSGIKPIGHIEIPEVDQVQYVLPNGELNKENGNGNKMKLNLLSKILHMLQWEQKRELASETLANNYGFIELTYMLKNQKPFLYQPIYYVKYKIPMISFLAGAKTLISQKPQLSTDPARLLQELIIDGNVSEISPNLQGFRKEDILKLTFNDGDLVQAKVLDEKALTLNEQIKLIHNLNSDVSAEDILQQNQKNAAKYYTGDAADLESLAEDYVPLRGMADVDAGGNVDGLGPLAQVETMSSYEKPGKLDLSNEFDASLGYSPTRYSFRSGNTTPYMRSGEEETTDTRQPQNTTSKE